MMQITHKPTYILDTNIYGLSLLEHHTQLSTFVSCLRKSEYVTSCFVLSELKVLRKSYNNISLHSILEIIDSSDIIWFSRDEIDFFVEIKSYMAKRKIHNRTIDWFIAAQCLAGDFTLVTANIKDFRDIPGLKVKFYNQAKHSWLDS
jgi:predicted nucleic acid-binding protein